MSFEKTRKKFWDYRRLLLSQEVLPFNAGLVEEVGARLEQLELILLKIQILDQNRVRYVSRENTEVTDGKFLHNNAFEVRMFAEAFYYFAGRARGILKHREKPCPLLGSFECSGVRNVRNLLIEHPEGSNSLAFTWSWTLGGVEGPALKVHREAGEKSAPIDLGLNINAREFRENLDAKLEMALQELAPNKPIEPTR